MVQHFDANADMEKCLTYAMIHAVDFRREIDSMHDSGVRSAEQKYTEVHTYACVK